MKKFIASTILATSLFCSVGVIPAFATGQGQSIDSINSTQQQTQTQQGNSSTQSNQPTNSQSSGTDRNEGVSNYMKGYKPITDENMKTASTIASPIVTKLGNIGGFILILTTGFIFVVTCLDLAYIALPFTRNFLCPQQAQGSAGGMGGMGMGGMGMGMGGHQHGGMSGGGQARGIQWISDEAKMSVQAISGGSQGGMSGGMGGMGMGMGMGGMGMGGQQQEQPSTKSVIFSYFKSRTFFLILFGVASLTLTSSIFLNCGINIAELIFKIMEQLNSSIGSAM